MPGEFILSRRRLEVAVVRIPRAHEGARVGEEEKR